MRIIIEVVPQKMVRNEGAGDWLLNDNEIHVLVADTGDRDSNLLIGLHEAVEAYECRKAGITEAAVTAFDAAYDGPLKEPGHSQEAPYHAQHEVAMKLEQYAAHLLHVPWRRHEKRIDALFTKK